MYSNLITKLKEYLDGQEAYDDVPVIIESINLVEQAEAALNDKGIAIIIGLPRETELEFGSVRVIVPISVVENQEINHSVSGADYDPLDLVEDLDFDLKNLRPDTYWTPLETRTFSASDPEFGFTEWGLFVDTMTIIRPDIALIADHEDNVFIDHANNHFESTSPVS